MSLLSKHLTSMHLVMSPRARGLKELIAGRGLVELELLPLLHTLAGDEEVIDTHDGHRRAATMAVWNAASAAEVAPLAPVSVWDVDPIVRLYVCSRGELGIPSQRGGLDAFTIRSLNLLLFRLLFERRHEPRSSLTESTGTRCAR